MQIAMTTNDFVKAQRKTLLALVLSQRRTFVLACAGVRKRWKCAVVDGVVLTTPVGHWKNAICGGQSPSG